ncbi:uncharacterized protein PAC_08998 [Phialocephala subalpina]|uniref:Ubiquitin-like protease family profile domain-containing protein n=1 Tax=Phialocephala subalpina TaxID=576137 RepID=A0A1L7X245_9HELO|nr:uncharacterized protein PAC_08998 [Phialocephala subalpina]
MDLRSQMVSHARNSNCIELWSSLSSSSTILLRLSEKADSTHTNFITKIPLSFPLDPNLTNNFRDPTSLKLTCRFSYSVLPFPHPTAPATTIKMTEESVMRTIVHRDQVEAMRELFAMVRDAGRDDDDTQDGEVKLLRVLAEIMEIWQQRACGGDPVDCSLAFGNGGTVSLRDVLAIVPEKYQEYIVLEGYRQRGGSWLDEGVMIVLLQMFTQNEKSKIYFARGLAADSSRNLDDLTKDTHSSRLKYLIDNMSAGQLDWNLNDSYTIPATTEKIVFFWNYHENHWAVMKIDISGDTWYYTLYDSLPSKPEDDLEDDYTLKSVQDHALDLQPLICAASGIALPQRSELSIGASTKQKNSYDCGVFALVNAAALLTGDTIPKSVKPFSRRLAFLEAILKALKRGDGVNTAAITPGGRRYWEIFKSTATLGEKNYWEIFRAFLQGGSRFDRILVRLLDKLLDRGLEPVPDTVTKLKERFLNCMDKPLASEILDEDWLREVRLLPYMIGEKAQTIQETSIVGENQPGEGGEGGEVGVAEDVKGVRDGEGVDDGEVAEVRELNTFIESEDDTEVYGVNGLYGDVGLFEQTYCVEYL